MTEAFTADDIARLSDDIDTQLLELGAPGTGLAKGRTPGEALGEKQRQAIEAATGEDALTFLARFKQAARKDLCEEGGVLYSQWRKWKDVTNKDVLKSFGAVLVGMGLSGGPLQIAAVAIAVYVLYLGVQAFCAEA
jgi:hypothetical protein